MDLEDHNKSDVLHKCCCGKFFLLKIGTKGTQTGPENGPFVILEIGLLDRLLDLHTFRGPNGFKMRCKLYRISFKYLYLNIHYIVCIPKK